MPSTVAQETLLAQDTPLRIWINDLIAYLAENLPVIFLVVAVLVGTILIIRGGIKQAVIFAVGAALVFLLLTNLETIAEVLREELPLPPAEDGSAPGPAPTPGAD